MKGKHRTPGWAILVIALAVALIAAITIATLRQHADESRQAELLLSRLKEQSYHLDALEWKFERKPDLKVLEEVQQLESQIAQTLDELLLLDPGDERLEQLSKTQLEFETGIDEVYRLLAAGNLEKAGIIDKERVDPSFNALSDLIANTSAIYRERARQAEMDSGIGTTLIVIVAGTIIGFLFWQFQRLQLRTKLMEVEQKALQQSEERYRTIIETAHDLIWTLNNEGVFTFFNKRSEETSGYKLSELIGKSFAPLIFPEDLPKMQQALLKTLQGNPESYDVRVYNKDGNIFILSVNTVPLYENDKIIGTVSFGRDITEHKQFEEALQQSEEKYRNLISNIQDGVFLIQGTKIRFANEAFAKMAGYTVEDVIGKDFREFVAPEDLEMVMDYYHRRLAGEDVPREYEFRGKHRDGAKIIVSLNTGLINYNGQVASLGTVKDITEHKRAEEQIREQAALLDKAQEAILVWNLEDSITYWNKSAQRLYGWTAEEVISKNANELLYKNKEESPHPIESNKSVIERGEWSGELHHVTKDGREIIVESSWTLMRDNKGEPKSILVINTDITGKKNLEQQLLRAQRMESIGTLASGISHDINNVLAPIMLSLELLKEKFTDNESQTLIDILDRSARRGASLIKQVQSFARGVEGECIPLQTAHLISEIRQIAKETFPRSIEIRTETQKGLWTISGDATQLHQVLMNLCVNARDAMPDGGILSISAENHFIDENFAHVNIDARVGRYIVIDVTDTGTGIPSKIMDRIFEPFFTTKELGKGTGLGLSTALGIVKSHGGFINVYSEVGKGTTFKVNLPAITTTEIQKAEEPYREFAKGHGELILVVDDEDRIRDITSSVLKTRGYGVLTASNGMEAIALYEQNRDEIKLVLMDMMMPVMDGQAGIQELHKINPELKIIAASGLTEKDKLTKAAGTMNAFLPKPYTTEKLLRTIHEVLSAK